MFSSVSGVEVSPRWACGVAGEADNLYVSVKSESLLSFGTHFDYCKFCTHGGTPVHRNQDLRCGVCGSVKYSVSVPKIQRVRPVRFPRESTVAIGGSSFDQYEAARAPFARSPSRRASSSLVDAL